MSIHVYEACDVYRYDTVHEDKNGSITPSQIQEISPRIGRLLLFLRGEKLVKNDYERMPYFDEIPQLAEHISKVAGISRVKRRSWRWVSCTIQRPTMTSPTLQDPLGAAYTDFKNLINRLMWAVGGVPKVSR